MLYIVIVRIELWSKLILIAADKWFFIMTFSQAIVVSQTSAVITAEEKDIDTKEYFDRTRKKFFVFMSLIVVVNIVLAKFF